MEPPTGEMSGGAEATGWDPKMEETVGASQIWSVAFHDPLGKEE